MGVGRGNSGATCGRPHLWRPRFRQRNQMLRPAERLVRAPRAARLPVVPGADTRTRVRKPAAGSAPTASSNRLPVIRIGRVAALEMVAVLLRARRRRALVASAGLAEPLH